MDVSDDLDHIVFVTSAALVPEAAPNTTNTYEWKSGEGLNLVGFLPGDSADPGGAVAGSGVTSRQSQNVTSNDGSRIFFTSPAILGFGALYMRRDGVETVPISVSQRDGDPPDPQPSIFRGASEDGKFVFFTSRSKLTEDATVGNGAVQHGELYRYDTETGELTDLTVATSPSDAEGAVVETVLQISADGSRVYFVAQGDLADGATSGVSNLYAWVDGETRFVASLDTVMDADPWVRTGRCRRSVTAGGS